MNFKKNWFSYCLWGLYAFSACLFFLRAMSSLLENMPVENVYVRIAIVCIPFLLLSVLSAGFRHFVNCRGKTADTGEEKKKVNKIAWEIFAVLLIWGLGLFLRIYFLKSGGEEAAYFETARVGNGAVTPIAHGAQYIYVLLLRGIFFLVGNHFAAGILLQVFLQMAGAAVLYFAVRRLVGKTAAFAMLFGMMFLPEMMKQGLMLSPKMLYLLLYGLVLLMTGRFVRRQEKPNVFPWHSWIHSFVTGGCIGFLTYLDVSGITLLIPLTCSLFIHHSEETEEESHRGKYGTVFQWMTAFAGFVSVSLLCFALDAMQNATSFVRVFETWRTLFSYKGWSINSLFSALSGQRTMLTDILLVLITFLLLAGIPAFFVKRREEMQMPWFVTVFSIAILQAGSFYARGMGYEYLLWVWVLVLMGAGLQSLARQKDLADRKEILVSAQEEQLTEPVEQTAEKPLEQPQEKKINYIENPLPLPKKHEKRTMGYQKRVGTRQMKYDIEVSDDDDFDI